MPNDDQNNQQRNDQRPRMGQPGEMAPQVSYKGESALAREVGMPLRGDEKAPTTRQPDNGITLETDGNDATITRANEQGEPKEPLQQEGDTQQPQEEVAKGEPLPEFDPEKPEVVEAYTKQFTMGGGTALLMEALEENWYKNASPGPDGLPQGHLDEGVYAFLKTKHGLSKEDVQRFEAGQVALQQANLQSIYTQAGGQEKYAAALEWAKKGGYDDAGKKRFNEALDAGGQARKDAIDLLMQRFGTANPAPRRRVPEVTAADAGNPAGGNANRSGVQGYADYTEYQSELRKARQSGNQKQLDDVRRRFAASPWRGQGGGA